MCDFPPFSMALDHSQLVLVQFHPVSLNISHLPQLYLRKFVSTKRMQPVLVRIFVVYTLYHQVHVGEGIWEHFYATLGDKCDWACILARLIFDVRVSFLFVRCRYVWEVWNTLFKCFVVLEILSISSCHIWSVWAVLFGVHFLAASPSPTECRKITWWKPVGWQKMSEAEEE